MGRPATKWDPKVFASIGDIVASSVALENWDPKYLNLLRNSVNVSIPAVIDTTLAVYDVSPHSPGTYVRW